MRKKLTISIDMGAKNNGVFIVKTGDGKILEKKASCIVVDNINFSKQSRTQDRHRKRNNQRFVLARRLYRELIDLDRYFQVDKERQYHQEQIIGLLHNRGFDRVEGAYQKLDKLTIAFLKATISEIDELSTIEKIDEFINKSNNSEKLKEKLEDYRATINGLLNNLNAYMLKDSIKNDIEKIRTKNFLKFSPNTLIHIRKMLINNHIEFNNERGELAKQLERNEIDLKAIDFDMELEKIKNVDKEYVDNILILENDLKLQKSDKENDPSLLRVLETLIESIATGAKPRKMYQKEIFEEITKFTFIEKEDKEKIYHIVTNISNLQLRVLRKYFNGKLPSESRLNEKKLSQLLHKYFVSRHYTKDYEKVRRKDLFKVFTQYINPQKSLYNAREFLEHCPPTYTIPPYEDMNNRDTYKCNSLLINANKITSSLEKAIDSLIKESHFDMLLDFSIKNKKDYAKTLQRILDINSKNIDKLIYPRNVFKHQKDGTNIQYYQNILKENFKNFSSFAKEFYIEEERAINGIFDENDKDYIFEKCAKNTPAKRNIKHELINSVFGTAFEKASDIDILIEQIQDKKIKTKLEKISKLAKKYQNEFFKNLLYAEMLKNSKNKKNEYENIDNEIKDILLQVDFLLKTFQQIFIELNQKSYLNQNFVLDDNPKSKGKNLKRFLNSIKQIYDILFNNTGGHNKTCSSCTLENNARSNEEYPLAKRLLSDVAKPINGKLDMLLERIAWEVVKQIDSKILNDVGDIEILLEQNKFNFEKSLYELKIRKKEPEEEELAYNICPYTGEQFNVQNGEYDHIVSQSSSLKNNIQVYNSEANLILCSSNGNTEKSNKIYTFNDLKISHLKIIFGTEDKQSIEKEIIGIWDNPKSGLNYYTAFKNLKVNEQRAFRYALFFSRDSTYFKKAEKLLQQEYRSITNGTQKRLAKLIFEKFPNSYKKYITVKVIDNKLVSSTRKDLAEYYRKVDKKTGEVLKDSNLTKQDKQDSYSHIVDAMVVYYVANKLKLEDFNNDINMNAELNYTQSVKTEQWYDTQNKNYKINSKRLFDEKDIGVGYIQLKKIVEIDSKGKERTRFERGVIKKYFVPSQITKKDFDFFYKIGIFKSLTNGNFYVDKDKLYDLFFDKKEFVLCHKSHFKKLTKDLRYTFTKVNPFESVKKFLEAKTSDDKKAIFKIIEKDRPSLEDITFKNLMAWFSRSSKLEKNSAKLGYYKSWEIFTKIIMKNKKELFSIEERKPKQGEPYKCCVLDYAKALEFTKIGLFKTTHTRRRDKKKNEYNLYSASKNDTQYIHRRKVDGKYIYQTRIANGHNKLKGFKKGFSEDGKYFFENSSNIIPLTMENYIKAFGSK